MIAKLMWTNQVASRHDTSRMSKLAFFILRCTVPLFIGTLAWSAHADGQDSDATAARSVLDGVERKIAKEPAYDSSPRYAMLVLGTKAESKIWMVEDGKALYVDKNANGDLSDDGPPIAPTHMRQLGLSDKGIPKWDCDYVIDELTPQDGSRHTEFVLRRWNYGDKEVQYGLSLMLDGRTPMYAGWFGTFWAASPEKVPLIHFGGPLYPHVRFKEFVVDSGARRLSIAFINPGRGEGASSYLSFNALPTTMIPLVQIDWPVAEGAPPLRTSNQLTERCCYWEFYDPKFQVPQGAVAGTATVTISLPGGAFPLELATDQLKVPVRAKDLDSAVK